MAQESNEAVCPESTIESANRRNFIRKAAAVTAAVGVGGILLDRESILPESFADKIDSKTVTTDTYDCNLAGNMAIFNGESDVTGANCKIGYMSGTNCCTAILNVLNYLCHCCGSGTYGGLGCSSAGVSGYSFGSDSDTAGVAGVSCKGVGVAGKSYGCRAAVCGYSYNYGPGISGSSNTGVGVCASSVHNSAIYAASCVPTIAKFANGWRFFFKEQICKHRISKWLLES